MPLDPAAPRFARQRVLDGFGASAQQRLAAAHVVVVGAGGLGSAVLPAIVGAGVGTITIVDDDTVDASNLHRQTLHRAKDVGRLKVESAAEALRAMSPDTVIHPVAERFTGRNALDLLLDADLLIDGSDNAPTRYLCNDIAAVRGIPLVWGSAVRYTGQAGVAWDERGVDYRDLFPEAPDAESLSCELVGVLPPVCTVIGGVMAAEAIKLLTGIGEPLLGRVAIFDARSGGMREVRYEREPGVARPGSIEERTAERELDGSTSIDSPALAAELAGDQPPMLIDVREPHEHSFVALPGSTLIPLRDVLAGVDPLDRDADIVLYCHHGVRSGQALASMQTLGFTRVRHLTGGIDAYARAVDPAMPRY
tara:strand:- start:338 stop:1432 length:1095 start_codon:yes stop_codon:yes gene_type:complete